MDRYAQVLSGLLEKHSIRLSIAEATKLILGKSKVTGYKLLKTGNFPLPVYGGGKDDHYVRLQDVAALLCDVGVPQVARPEIPPTPARRRVGRPTRAEQLAEERRRALDRGAA